MRGFRLSSVNSAGAVLQMLMWLNLLMKTVRGEQFYMHGAGSRFLDHRGLRLAQCVAGALTLLLFMVFSVPAQSQRQLRPRRVVVGAEVVSSVKPTTRKIDLRRQSRRRSWRRGEGIRYIPKRFYASPKLESYLKDVKPRRPSDDPLVGAQRSFPQRRAFTSTEVNTAGIGFSGAVPPDPTVDVGSSYVIQATNTGSGSTFNIYDKSDGTLEVGPLSMQDLATGGTDCAQGAGDPIILYDEAASRWMLSEFSEFGNKLCVYISITSDPITGGWYNYEFSAPYFPDYPKYAVWTDAYYFGTNEDSGPALYAIDRTRMLAGLSATMQRFQVPSLSAFSFQMLTPVDIDGPTPPPAGSPGIFMRHRDDEAHNSGSANSSSDQLEIYEMSIDWDTPSSSQLSGPIVLTVAEFDSHFCGYTTFSCLPQPNGATDLDPLREVVMWGVQYRNMGSYEAIVGSHVTDTTGTDVAGPRWWELRRLPGGNWTVHQEGTYSPDSHNRWMSSAAMDQAGNIALAYSIGSATLNPGIRYTGRLATDPAGVMTQGETTIANGAGQQWSERYGDYSSMSVDPSDGCTFWYTNEYITGSGNWATRLASFAFDSCLGGSISLTGSSLTQNLCVPPNVLTAIPVAVTGLAGFTDDVDLAVNGLPSGFSPSFSSNPVTPPGSSDLLISVDSGVAAGSYSYQVVGGATGVADATLNASVEVYTTTLAGEAPALTSPADGSTADSAPDFTWAAVSQAVSYTLEVDDDPAFSSLDYTWTGTGSSHTPASPLPGNTTYYWRVRVTNPCGSDTSAVRSFYVAAPTLFCETPNLSIPDGGGSPAEDQIDIVETDLIDDLELRLVVAHTYVGDLRVRLTHADTGTAVDVIDRPGVPALGQYGCNESDIDATLSDAASDPVEDECALPAPAISGTFSPNSPLSAFDGEGIDGTWKLSVWDEAGGDNGQIVSWCLEPTYVPEPGAGTMLLTGILAMLAERKRRRRRLS